MTRIKLLVLLSALFLVALAGCSRAEPTPSLTSTPGVSLTPGVTTTPGGSPVPTANPTQAVRPATSPSATAIPQRAPPPTRAINFTVHAPGPPDGESVHILLQTFVEYQWLDHVQLTPAAGGAWTGTFDLPEGALVRYVYDHWDDEEFENFKSKREAHGDSVNVEGRLLYVGPGVIAVEDTVETWTDARETAPTGVLTGVVTDAETGAPVVDANVSVGGVHGASNFQGRFTFTGVALGLQRVTVYETLGEHRMAAVVVEVTEGQVSVAEVEMQPAREVMVTFDVSLPPGTPAVAEIRVAGSVYQMGARSFFPNFPLMGSDLFIPALERVSESRATGTLTLREGTYVEYSYSIGGLANLERGSDGSTVIREFIVDDSAMALTDSVDRWTPEFTRLMTVRVTVPPNTPSGVPVYVERGPMARMAQTGPREWVSWIDDFPGATPNFRFMLGGVAGDAAGRREVTFGDSDGEVQFRIEQWEDFPAVDEIPDGGQVEATFNVSLPSGTPPDAWVSIEFGAPGLGAPVDMTHLGGSLWQVTVDLRAGDSVDYRVVRAGGGGGGLLRSIDVPRYTPLEVNDWVSAWSDEPAPAGGTRPEFITGFYPPDYWSENFRALSPTTFENVAAHNGGWVALSSVWSYGNIRPLPTVESRPIESGSVYTPRPEIIGQAQAAHEAGLSVLLAPQFNMEMSDGGIEALAGNDQAWWDAWAEEAREFWMWNAQVAAEVDAEALLLPGYVFHVFAQSGFLPSQESFDEFDQKMIDLVAEVRSVYSGRILISGGVLDSRLPGVADLVGVTTYDTGHPDLPADAPLEEWVDAYEQIFQERVDPRWEAWGVPVLFYTVHSPSPGGDRLLQAKRLEAIYQVIARRPWIAGSFSWSYGMVGTAMGDNDGVRDRPGEAVLAKWYGLFGGQD